MNPGEPGTAPGAACPADDPAGEAAPDLTASYAAFLSYSHALDGALAPALQTSLEQFARKWYQRRALRVFRDDTNLSATPHLWNSIELALASSEWFVLLASPESARSPWVQREISWWLSHRSPDRIIVAVTAGSVTWDEQTSRVDQRRTDALPPVFADDGLPEPRWVDLVPLRAAEQTDPAFQAAVVDIAATLHGRPKDDLIGEQVRQHRKRRRSILLTAAALVVLTLISMIAAGVAVVQRDRAEAQTRIAIARQFTAQADALADSDLRSALRLREAAATLDPGPETTSALVHNLQDRYLRRSLVGHIGQVTSVAYSADGTTLATGGGDGTVAVWSTLAPGLPRRLAMGAAAVNTIAFSPRGTVFAAGSADGSTRLWRAAELARPESAARPPVVGAGAVLSIAFSPDERTMSVSGQNGLALWNVADLDRPVEIVRLYSATVTSAAFSADARTLAVAPRGSGYVELWDVGDPGAPRRRPQLPFGLGLLGPQTLAFSPDGHRMASGSSDGSLDIWDADSAPPRRLATLGNFATGHNVRSVAFSRDGLRLAGAVDNTLILWDLTNPENPRQSAGPLLGHDAAVASVAFSPDGHGVATGSSDRTAILWDVVDAAAPTPLGTLPSGSDFIWHPTFSPSGDLLAAVSNSALVLWDVRDPRTPRQLSASGRGERGFLWSLAFSPDGHVVATAGDDQAVVLSDVTDPGAPRQIGTPLAVHTAPVTVVAFSPNGRVLAAGSKDRTVSLWDLADPTTPRMIGRLGTDLAQGVYSVAFSPDGLTIAVGGQDGAVLLWRVDDLAQRGRLDLPPGNGQGFRQSIAFSPDGRFLAASGSGDYSVVMWDVTDPDHARRTDKPLLGHSDAIQSLAYSANGLTLATASSDGTVTLWDLSDPDHPAAFGRPLTAHRSDPDERAWADQVYWVGFSSNRRMVSGSENAVNLWDMRGADALRSDALERACAITAGGLTAEQWARSTQNLPYENSCSSF